MRVRVKEAPIDRSGDGPAPALAETDLPVAGAVAARRAPELSVVIPTLNERENILPLLERLDAALAGVDWEVIFVDDDLRDGTPDHVRSIARRDARVRCLHRIGRRGLSTACIEGIMASAAPYVAVMDADLQHDEAVLPRMLATLREEPYDIVVGSRYVERRRHRRMGQPPRQSQRAGDAAEPR